MSKGAVVSVTFLLGALRFILAKEFFVIFRRGLYPPRAVLKIKTRKKICWREKRHTSAIERPAQKRHAREVATFSTNAQKKN